MMAAPANATTSKAAAAMQNSHQAVEPAATSSGENENTSTAAIAAPAATYATKLLSSTSSLPSSATGAASCPRYAAVTDAGFVAAAAQTSASRGQMRALDTALPPSKTGNLKQAAGSNFKGNARQDDGAAGQEKCLRGSPTAVKGAESAGSSQDPVNAALRRLNSKLQTARSLPSAHRRMSRYGGRFGREGEGSQRVMPPSPSPLSSSPLSSTPPSRRASVSPEGRPAGGEDEEAPASKPPSSQQDSQPMPSSPSPSPAASATSRSARENNAQPSLLPATLSVRDDDGPVSPSGPPRAVSRATVTEFGSSREEGRRAGHLRGAADPGESTGGCKADGLTATNKQGGRQGGKDGCRKVDGPLSSVSTPPPAAAAAAAGSSAAAGGAATAPGSPSNPLYKTEMCRSWEETGSCRYGAKCQFAHGSWELRPVARHPKYKTEVSRQWQRVQKAHILGLQSLL